MPEAYGRIGRLDGAGRVLVQCRSGPGITSGHGISGGARIGARESTSAPAASARGPWRTDRYRALFAGLAGQRVSADRCATRTAGRPMPRSSRAASCRGVRRFVAPQPGGPHAAGSAGARDAHCRARPHSRPPRTFMCRASGRRARPAIPSTYRPVARATAPGLRAVTVTRSCTARSTDCRELADVGEPRKRRGVARAPHTPWLVRRQRPRGQTAATRPPHA